MKRKAKAAPKKRAAPKRKIAKPIPDGYHALTPYLSIAGAAKAIEFYKKVFGAREKLRMDAPGGKIGHAELKIGDSIVMLADESPEMGFMSPKTRGGVSVGMHLYVKNCDAVFDSAVAAGAKVLRPIKDQFYGDRSGTIEDPFGHMWNISTHTEELSMGEIRRRAAAMKPSGAG
jgi:PhnB protein